MDWLNLICRYWPHLAALLASVHALLHKREVIVYDYVDGCVPVLSAMYSKRVRGYEAVGYSILIDDSRCVKSGKILNLTFARQPDGEFIAFA